MTISYKKDWSLFPHFAHSLEKQCESSTSLAFSRDFLAAAFEFQCVFFYSVMSPRRRIICWDNTRNNEKITIKDFFTLPKICLILLSRFTFFFWDSFFSAHSKANNKQRRENFSSLHNEIEIIIAWLGLLYWLKILFISCLLIYIHFYL